MDSFEVYTTYVALKTHFSRKTYDYFKYQGEVKVSREKFATRNDIYFFEKISLKYDKEQTIKYFVSNFLVNSNFHILQMNDNNFAEWNRKMQSISYLFLTDLDAIIERSGSLNDAFQCSNGHSDLLKLYLGGRIMMETLIMLNKLTGFIERYDNLLSTDVIWKPLSFTLKKYDPFLQGSPEQIKELVLKKL